MKVFVTGATGFIGSRVVPELIARGHEVIGLTRSDAGAKSLEAAGARAHRGSLEDVESLTRGAAQAEGVIHTAFDHENFADFAAVCEKDRVAIEALARPLRGTRRPLLITSGVGIGSTVPGQPATEDAFDAHHKNPRILTEITGQKVAEQGVNVIVIRLPQVHDAVKQGLITYQVQIAREKGVSAYVGDGANRWAAVHVDDAARAYVIALEKGEPGRRYNLVAEEGVASKRIAEAIAQGLGVPAVSIARDQAAGHFGWMALFAGMDLSASSALTRQRLDWHPNGPDLLADLARMDYTPRG